MHGGCNELHKAGGKSVDVLRVQGIRRFVQRKNATILAEGIGEREPNDDGSQHFLTSRTPTTHVHLYLIFGHDNLKSYSRKESKTSDFVTHAIIVRSFGSAAFDIRANFNSVNVYTQSEDG